jgi:polysaccharide export outer membrane protein
MLLSRRVIAMIVATFTVAASGSALGMAPAAPASSAQVAPLPAQNTSSDYRVGAGDLLRINVFDHPELQVDLRVSESGKIAFPLLGEMTVAGMSTRDVESSVTRGLATGGFVRAPQVTVLVTDFQSQKISVMGQVSRPGQYALTASEHVLDALAQAGGVINLIAADDATLLRKDGTKVALDLIALFSGDPTQNPPISGGDAVYVPRAPQFYIYGQVQRPGVYRLERKMTVSQAISAGGGLTSKGSERWLAVKRRDASGKERKVSVSSSDFLQADDVLLVKESLF